MLDGILPRLGWPYGTWQYVIFEDKQDLEKRLPIRVKAWQDPNCVFLIMRDQDSGDCCQIKQNLLYSCRYARQFLMVRVACRELESFYLGDLAAVEQGLSMTNLSRHQENTKFRNPDLLHKPSQELSDLTRGNYQKVLGSREIGSHLKLDCTNKSHSFNILIDGIITLLHYACHA